MHTQQQPKKTNQESVSILTKKSLSETFSEKRIFVNGANNRAQDHSAFRNCVIDDTTDFSVYL
jgi:hypothetical protein